ncbi:hypothetical protein PR202_gn00055 [Eleusine coracana subsp. coracana]|uniref:DUF4216 domain-containing protein n=1 Tax=Eleusine coracana subsp. coracana TaxID=191504 RepID=A0AAV5F7M7_ELECO|nr:hypothetical protein PR202_gb20069 [Eleusine coracana subsp. coracana]GJN40757.1 hypothetical protein PR202_gn00055 [Eleusine coracana subsp. coracana]
MFFKCDLVDNHVQNKWIKTYQFGLTSVNFKHLFNISDKIYEPFILASQAAQFYYVRDVIDTKWLLLFSQNLRTCMMLRMNTLIMLMR